VIVRQQIHLFVHQCAHLNTSRISVHAQVVMILVILLQRFYPILVVKLARNPAISSQPSAISQPFVCNYDLGESLDLTVSEKDGSTCAIDAHQRLSQLTLPKALEEAETQSWRVSFRSEWDLRARSSIISS
jgi:hypothetical protein